MKLALMGNQNAGKTSLFNALTGSNQKVGNWPGVTIDRVEGKIKKHNATIVDLPGVYSLSPYTSEEEISRRFVLDEDLDLIINIVDATSLERSLYLTTQLLELNIDVIIALNMCDLLRKKGMKIDINKLSKQLGVTIVPISAKTGSGIDVLIDTIFKKKFLKNKNKPIYPTDVEDFIKNTCSSYRDFIRKKHQRLHLRFAAVKILEEDRDYRVLMDSKLKASHLKLEKKYGMDGEQLIASLRYDYIEKVKKDCVIYLKHHDTKTISDKLDEVFLHKYLAIPIFVVIMAIVYFLAISVIGGLTSNPINVLFNGGKEINLSIGFASWNIPCNFIGIGPAIANGLSDVGASKWAVSLVSNGVIGGVTAVVSFLPQLAMLFICLGILETSGYMSRISFFLDRVFHRFGLSGKSLVPFIVGAGCTVPGVMTTRTIEDESEKKRTIILTPFVPCNAKLTIISLIVSSFFARFSFLFALIFYVMAIFIIFTCAFLMKKIFKNPEHSTFISELPEYKAPNAKYVLRDVSDKTLAFIKRAGTIVLFFSILVWVLTSFTWDFRYVDGAFVNINDSMLAGIGNAFAWFFYPMLGGHWSWAASVSALQGLVAKEQVVSSMQVIANMANHGVETSIFSSPIFSFFTPLSSFAFATFNLFSIPCVGSLGAMRAELKSTKKLVFTILFEIAFAWCIATLIGAWGMIR